MKHFRKNIDQRITRAIAKKGRLIIATSCMCLLTTHASADWGVSLNVDNEIGRYKQKDTDAFASLGLQYRGEKFNIDNKALSYSLLETDKYAVEIIGKSNNGAIDPKDLKFFKGMDKRKASLDLGARAMLKTKYGPLALEATRDVYASKGFSADLKFGGIEPHADHWNGKREFKVAGVAGVKYQNNKTADYYYGVKASETTASRAAYKAAATTTPYIGVESQLNLSKHFSFDAGLVYEKRDDAMRNSPLTNDKDYDVVANLGVTYWF
ncbi:MipA/OmpV family protein [Cocleimonas sp. KMM 6892]|uniref:MipA/OmpV family protein n=1 Tax=unclassified Cocleimonas TaxID=2639732 RepID=UPI002DB89C8A|nr:MULTISPECIES: MipA/OmpV family protein [unclassified Cocleimonas]MEB8433954.1 MipA/OmpV family protein [Cocleimonas sp. KMM 6892]MEC4716765.1 MipA/OmpV family protein [Cocleimonas sp. KMM 6895]MEC4746080.1 MipA/OmpV family protein [Cocleimonas sp. KMM 6896]